MDVEDEPTPQATKDVPITETISEANNESVSHPDGKPETLPGAPKIPMPGAVKLIGSAALDAEFKKKVEERQRRLTAHM